MAATAKKPISKKTVVKKPTTKKATTKQAAAKSTRPQSFRVTSNTTDFFKFQPTIQTVYWLVLSGIVLALGLWVIQLNARVQSIYDQIDLSIQSSYTVTPAKPVKH